MLLKHAIRYIIEHPVPQLYRQWWLQRALEALDQYAVNQIGVFSEEEIHSIQVNKIRRVIQSAYDHVPFWRGHFNKHGINCEDIKSLSDLDAIPVVSKRDLKGSGLEYSWTEKASERFIDRTSGSTGEPFVFYLDPGGLLRRGSIYTRNIQWMTGMSSPVVRIQAKNSAGISNKFSFVTALGPGDIEKQKETLYALLARDGVVLEGISSLVYHLALCMQRDGIVRRPAALSCFGEQMTPAEHTFLENFFQCPVYHFYGSREIARLAQTCTENNGYHINADWQLIQVVDDEGRSLPADMVGRVVITTFENQITPLIRYEIGDVGMIMSGVCPCGNTLPRLRFVGRSADKIVLPSGGEIHAFEFTRVFNERSSRIMQYQIIQRHDMSIEVLVVPRDELDLNDTENIRQVFLKKTKREVPIVVTATRVTNTVPTTGKRPVFISELTR